MADNSDTRSRGSKRQSASSENQVNKKVRSCEKAGCNLYSPSCCLETNNGCAFSGYTSRWYHMSNGEHFCNNCFDFYYRPAKEGNSQFNKWTQEWAESARVIKPSLKRFVASKLLPYWLKCTNSKCGKWRKVFTPETPEFEFIRNFKCISSPENKNPCEVAEDLNVNLASMPRLMDHLTEEPLLQKSAAAFYLQRFLPEDLGMCPISPVTPAVGVIEDIELFDVNQRGESCIWVKPDLLDSDDVKHASKISLKHPIYLGLKNLLVTLWNLTPSQWLTIERASPYIICRGLVRIYLVSAAEKVLDFITSKAIINHGIVQNPKPVEKEQQVLVIGAGVAGLAAASHLQNLGVNVTVYEAKSTPGGRVKDDPVVGMGAFFIQGVLNNPFITLCMQAGVEYHALESKLVIFNSEGGVIPNSVVLRAQHEVSGLLHGAVESVSVGTGDPKCQDIIMDNCYAMKNNTQFCREPAVFSQILSCLEIDLKADFNDLSLRNFEFPNALCGEEAFIPGGLNVLLDKLSDNLNIVYDKEVQKIDYNSDMVEVSSSDGDATIFDKVIVTVPVSVLRSGSVQFSPSLPDYKCKAVTDIGDFYCEKVILEFSNRFWTKNQAEAFSKFAILSSDQVFELFYDVTNERKDCTPTLMCWVSQESIPIIKDLTDAEVVRECMCVLKNAFSDSVPSPTSYCVTHWSDEQFGNSFGSYPKVGGSSSTFSDLAKSLDNKVYFAGEATFKNILSTVTGAYLSGLREAANVMQDVCD